MSTLDRAVDSIHWRTERWLSFKLFWYLNAAIFFGIGTEVLLSNTSSFETVVFVMILWLYAGFNLAMGRLSGVQRRLRELDDVDRKLADLIIALDEPIPVEERFKEDR